MAHEHPGAELVGSMLAKMGARTTTISTILRGPSICGREAPASRIQSLTKKIYRDAIGKSSRPGLMPSETNVFFKNDRQIMHASMILTMAWGWRHLGPEEAFLRSYRVYWVMTGSDRDDVAEIQREISADRAWLLIQRGLLPMQRWVQAKARGQVAATPEIRLLRCRSCSNPVIATPVDLRVTCPVCLHREQDSKG